MRSWKTIRIIGIVLLCLVIIGAILLGSGNYLLHRYLNKTDKSAINKILPINGIVSYDKISIEPFRNFPKISIKVHDIQFSDSLYLKGESPVPVSLENLYINASIDNFKEKQASINSIELSGLNLSLLKNEDGYSNLRSILKRKISENANPKSIGKWKVDLDYSELYISDFELHKKDVTRKQDFYLLADRLAITSSQKDSAFILMLEIDNLVLTPFSNKSVEGAPIQVDKVKGNILTDRNFSKAKLENIDLKNGAINLSKFVDGRSNFSGIVGAKQRKKKKEPSKPGPWFDYDSAKLNMKSIDFLHINERKKRHLEAEIRSLSSNVDAAPFNLGQIDFHLKIDQLAFNKDKGAFLQNADVKGKVDAKTERRSVKMFCDELSINNENFKVKSQIFLQRQAANTLSIEKLDARTVNIRPLLSEHIQKQILTYDVKGPMYAKADLVFTPGIKKARIDLDMKVKNKSIIVRDEKIKNANISATFINGLYDDERQYTEDKKNLRLIIDEARGEINEFYIDTKNALITSTPEDGARLISNAKVTGKAASTSKFFNHDRFTFRKGAFVMSTSIDAPLNNLSDFIAGTDADLAMKDLEVFYPEGNTMLPLSTLDLKKSGEKTTFNIVSSAIEGESPIHIEGEVYHIASALFDEPEEQLETNASIRASSMSWEGLIGLFGKDGLVTVVRKNDKRIEKRSMKQTLTGIQRSFSPTVDLAVDTLRYGKDVQFLDFNTGLKFEDDKTLILEQSSFSIDGSKVSLDGEVIINELDFTKFDFDLDLQNLDFDVLLPKFDYFGVHIIEQIKDKPDNLTMHVELSGELDDDKGLRPESIDANITYESFAQDKFTGSIKLKANPSTKKIDVVFGHSGLPRSMNYLLGLEEYRFDKGWFNVSFEFADNYESFAQMLENSKVGLTVADAEVYIADIGVTVPLSTIEVSSIDNIAYYHILLKSDSLNQELALNGKVENIGHFAFRDTDEPYEVDLNISSPRIVWNDLKQVIAFANNGSQKSGKIIKESMNQILQDFNPNVRLAVDQFEFSEQIAFDNIFAHAYMENDILKIDSANVAFGDSELKANIDADMSHDEVLPFHINLGLTNIDIAEILMHFNYFNQEELASAQRIDGNLYLDLDMKAQIDLINNGYIEDKVDAKINANVLNLVVEDLETINKLSQKIRREERFKMLRFAPIESQIRVKGHKIEIENTEVQSNAIQAFVEGSIDKKSKDNLWITIPLRNLQKPDLEYIPEKTGSKTRRNIFIEWISSEEKNNGKIKLRLSRKKLLRQNKRNKAI